MSILIPEQSGSANPYINRIKLLHGDIAQQDVDAVVTLLPHDLDYEGAINNALTEAAGHPLNEFVRTHIVRPVKGEVYAVPGFNLPCKHVFFCIIPRWKDDFERHDKYLINVCRRAMETAEQKDLRSIAFPPLGSGRNGFPKARAARLIVQGILDRMHEDMREVRIVCSRRETIGIFESRLFARGWTGYFDV